MPRQKIPAARGGAAAGQAVRQAHAAYGGSEFSLERSGARARSALVDYEETMMLTPMKSSLMAPPYKGVGLALAFCAFIGSASAAESGLVIDTDFRAAGIHVAR